MCGTFTGAEQICREAPEYNTTVFYAQEEMALKEKIAKFASKGVVEPQPVVIHESQTSALGFVDAISKGVDHLFGNPFNLTTQVNMKPIVDCFSSRYLSQCFVPRRE